jgi:hypothetical protein
VTDLFLRRSFHKDWATNRKWKGPYRKYGRGFQGSRSKIPDITIFPRPTLMPQKIKERIIESKVH